MTVIKRLIHFCERSVYFYTLFTQTTQFVVDNDSMVKFILLFSLLTIVSCSGGDGAPIAEDTLKEFEIKDNFCQVTIDEDSTDLSGVLFTQCSDTFNSTQISSATRVVLDAGNTCEFVSIDGSNTIISSPHDDHVGTCDFQISLNDNGSNVYLKAKVIVRNINPLLNIPDVNNIEEDSALAEVLSDVLVQATDEGHGIYFFDNASTTGTKCSDNGTLNVNEQTGAVSFGPNLNFTGACNVVVGFDDQNPGSDIAYNEFSINVVSNNDQPDITGGCATASISQDVTYNCSTLSFVDNDIEDTHTWSLASSNTCPWVSVDPTTGAISGTPNDDQVGGCNVSVVVNDGNVDSVAYTRSVTINNVTPVLSPLSTVNPITEDDPATVVLSAVNVSSDEEGFGTYSLDNANTTGTKCSDNGTVSINPSNGEVTYTPALNFDQNCNVRVVFDDGNLSGNTAAQQTTIVVTAGNDIHAITSACASSVDELVAYSCTGAYTDVENDTVTWSFAPGNTCSWLAINATTGNITGTPARSDVGTCDLVVRADDGEYQVDRTYNLTVNNVQPSFTIADVSLAEDSASTEIRADADVASTDEGYGSYSVVAASSNDCQSEGTVSVDASTGAVTFAPAINYDTNCNIRIQFDDGQASDNIGFDEFVVTMIPSPDNAVVSLPVSCDGNHDEDVAYTCTPTIDDPDTGDTHTWSADTNTCAWIPSVASATGVMTGTPNDNHVGACTFTIKATGSDALVSPTLTANITIDNVRPIISFGTNPSTINMQHTNAPVQYAAVIQNTATDFNMVSTDETYGVYSLVAPTTGTDCSTVADTLTIDTGSGVISFLPNDMYVGTCNIGVSFDDENSTDNVAVTYDFEVIVQDQVPPLISYVDSLNGAPDDGLYTLDQTVDLVVKFDEPVVVNTTGGSPRLFLETGAIDRQVAYTGQNGDRTEMRFQYTVQQDDTSSDLSVHSTVGYLDLGGALVEDDYGNTEVNFPVPKPADVSGNSLQERRAISVDGSVAAANATGLPTLVSPATLLDVTVSGGDVVNYRYKIKEVGSANDTCIDSTDYSANVPVGTKITDSLVSFPLGASIRICIIGVNSSGILQPYSTAFEYVWSKDVKSVQKISFEAINDLPNFQDSEVDPDNPNIIYARNLLGEVYKSEDYGANWDKQCTLPVTYTTDLVVSPGPDRTPYAGQSSTLYKIVDTDGGACENLLSSASLDVDAGFGRGNYEFAINGDIYIYTEANGSGEIWRSFDQGANWSLYTSVTANAPGQIEFSLNPHDVSMFLITGKSYNDPTSGVYRTTDGGATYDKRTSLNDKTHSLSWHPTDENLVYSNWRVFTHKSRDGGDTWEAAGADNGTGQSPTDYYQRYDIDKVTGHAYRVVTSGSDSLLQRATDILSAGAVSWTTLHTFSGVTGTSPNARNVSVSGNAVTPSEPTIAVNIINRMWVSSDGGSSFTEVFAPEELKLATVAGAGDNAIYGATKDWFVVKTSDNGDNWEYRVGDYYQCLGKPPRLAVNQLDTDNILMWTDNYGTIDCDNFNYSVDAMSTLVSRDEFSMTAPKLVVSMSPYDPKKYYMSGKPGSGDFRFHKTSNSAFETTVKYSPGNQFTSPMPDSYIHPHNDKIVWVVDEVGSGILYEYDLDEGTRVDISSRTGLSSLAAIDVYVGDKGQYFLRAMDRTGRMKVSSDYGASFIDEGTTGSPLSSCNKRFLYHHPRDRNLVVSACVQGNVVGLSRDAGQSWDETDLFIDYNINCSVTGLAVSSSRIYLGCESADTMIFNYAFARLRNGASDSVLTVAENSASNDIVEHFFPDLYSTIEYKVVPSGTACDATEMSSGASTTIPKTDDAVFTTRGEYQVCVKQTDSSANVTYSVTSTIFFDTGLPTFTSVDLAGDVADGELTYVENQNRNYLIDNLVSTNHDFVGYVVVEDTVTCDGTLSYSYEIPKSDDSAFKDATDYKVCLELTTRGDVKVYGASSTITFVPTEVYATLTGLPEAYVSIDDTLNVSVAGASVAQYKYKVITSTNSCSDASGYSSAIPIATPITDSLTGFSHGDHLKLCVIGGDASGYFQRVNKATTHFWVYSTDHRFDFVDMSAITSLNGWRQVQVAPNNQNIIYAFNTMGEIWKTFDAGANWELQCRISEYRSSMHLKVSPGDDATAYVSRRYHYNHSWYDRLYRIDALSGRFCSNTTSSFRDTNLTGFVHTSFSIDFAGNLYSVEDQYDSMVIRYSSDYGRNWKFLSQIQNGGLFGQLYFNPLDDDIVLLNSIADNSGSGTKGLHRSTDGGKTWSFVQATGLDAAQYIFFDPSNAGRVYGNNSYYSTDNGATWLTNAGYDSSDVRWWVTTSGVGYRLTQSGGDTLLLSDSDLATPSFSSLYTFSGIQSSDGTKDVVSATGSTLTVIIGDQLFLSTDSGTTFSEVFWPGEKLVTSGISSRDGNDVYAVTRAVNIIDSSDGGDSWRFITSQTYEDCENDAKVYAHHLDNDYAWVHSRDCAYRAVTTTDGFNTSTKFNLGKSDNGKYIATSAPLLNSYFMAENYNADSVRATTDGFSSHTIISEVDDVMKTIGSRIMGFTKISEPNTLVHIHDSQLILTRLNERYESLWITNRVPFTDVAGMAMMTDRNNLELGHLIISHQGKLAVSFDDLKSFSTIGSSPGLQDCTNRYLYINPNNNDLIVSACHHGDNFSWTTNGGSSWSSVDLETTYSIDCNISGITMNQSKIMFGCMNNVDAMEYFYTPVELINSGSDGVITGSEVSSTDLVSIAHSSYYSNIEYTIINAGGTCNVATPGYSTTVPTDSDLSSTGNYQVCVKLTNGAGTTYSTSTTIKYAASAPTFTSIDLINEAVDGVQLIDYIESSNPIVGNIIGASYTKARYALVPDATTCNGNITYTSTVPTTNSSFFNDAGDYKVCVAIGDDIHAPVFGSSATFSFSKTQVFAELSGLPNKTTAANSLNVTVGGAGVTHYRYKHGANPVNCADATGYSSEIAIATPITDSITSYGTDIIDLCVQAIDDTTHNDQLLSNASSYTFERANADINYVNFNINGLARDWYEVEIAKWTGAPHIYARDNQGLVFLSKDRGSSFSHICTLPVDTESGIYISPVQSVGAYASAGGNVYRLQDSAGDPCPLITSGFTNVATTYQQSPIAFTKSGEILIMDEVSNVSPEQTLLKKSSDLGNTWSTVYTFDEVGTNLSLYVDPFNDLNFFIIYEGTIGASPFTNDWILSKDGGETFEGFNSGGSNGQVDRIQDPQISFKFDPTNKGLVFANNGFYSEENLTTFYNMNGTVNNIFARWDIDSTGAAYRTIQDGGDIDIESSNNLTSPSFSTLATLSSITAGVKDRDISVSGDGATKAVVAGNRMFISLDGGAFNEVYTPRPRIHLSSVTSENHTNVYAVDKEWNVYKSTDSASNWSYASTYSSGCSNNWLRIRASKADSNYVLIHSDNDSNGCTNAYRTVDGFSTASSAASFFSTTASVLALDPADENNAMVIANGSMRNSTDFLSTFNNNTLNSMDVSGHGFDAVLSTVDNTLAYYVDNGLISVDDTADTKTNISASLAMSGTAAGMEGFSDGNIYVMSRTGELDISVNSGSSFASYATDPSLTSCNSRILRTLATDQANFISTACYQGTTLAYTTDAGVSWTEIDLSNYSFSNTCIINDISLVDQSSDVKMIVSCRDEAAIELSL